MLATTCTTISCMEHARSCTTALSVLAALLLQDCAGPTRLSESDRQLVLTAPIESPRSSFFHAALLVPAMQSARTLGAGTRELLVGTDHALSVSRRTIAGVASYFDGFYHEWTFAEFRAGAADGLELSARAAVSGWDEHLDHFLLRDAGGNLIVRDENRLFNGMASQRHENLSRLDLGGKVRIAGNADSSTALAAAVKLPVAREGDLTSSGTIDVALTLLETVQAGLFTFHGNAGGVVPLGSQTLFDPAADIDLNPFVHAALGADWRIEPELALALQVEANTSAFHDVPFLKEAPVTMMAGARLLLGNVALEEGLGVGFDLDRSYKLAIFLAVGVLF